MVSGKQRTLLTAVDQALALNGADFEDLCYAYAQAFRAHADACTHETVKSCLESAAEALDRAGLDWYVSDQVNLIPAAARIRSSSRGGSNSEKRSPRMSVSTHQCTSRSRRGQPDRIAQRQA